MKKTYKYEDIEQILAEADDLLQQIDPEIIAYLKEEQRAQLEEQAQVLKKLKSRFRRCSQGGTVRELALWRGHARGDRWIAKAMKALSSYLS